MSVRWHTLPVVWKSRFKRTVDAPPDDPAFNIAVVHFEADEATLARVDVAVGPCVAIDARIGPLVNPIMQDRGEGVTHTRSLYQALTGLPDDEALVLIAREGAGSLHRYSEGFLDACAEFSQRMSEANDSEWDALEAELDRAWMHAAEWPTRIVSLRNRIGRIHEARVARQNGLPLYCWHGPATRSITVVRGTGPYPSPN
jgi:hypothetical protein